MEKNNNLAKDVFLHLFNIVTFYLCVIAFITLYVQYINIIFPDKLNYYFSSIAGSVRVATSILFVAIPFYLLSAWLLAKDLKENPEKKEMKLNKWLIYFTLFVSAITIIIDLIVFVYRFLDGELSARFFLKVLVVLLVALAVFSYYIWDLKRKNIETKVNKILAILLLVLTLASIVAGFFIVGTPKDQRNRRFDDERIQNLQMIQSQIIDYWIRKQVLAENLDVLLNDISFYNIPIDPETNEKYEYNILGELSYELCANFSTSNKDTKFENTFVKYDYYPLDQNWEHEAGRICFTRNIDPDFYKDKEGLINKY